MTDSLTHRGPDSGGYELCDDIALGHRRLSILDLSDAAAQPMRSHNGRYSIVFNGEIFNFRDIALRLSNTKFRSTGDTEVILEAFVQWGPDFVKELNGMFAIAIYDRQDGDLWLFRDRVGIKPLYYGIKNGYFAFASEVKALRKLQPFSGLLEIDFESVSHFLHLGYIPAPGTIFREIRSLLPGCRGRFKNSEFSTDVWWSLKDSISDHVLDDEVQVSQRLEQLLQESVERCLVSDVPLATFLSGGVDSSLVTALAQQLSNQAIQTFSIGFKESKFDESGFARKVAAHLGTEHHEFIVSYEEAIGRVESILEVYDQPYADSSAIPTMLVSRMAREHVKVALSGDGGDETHLGYGAYTWAQRLSNPLIRASRVPIAASLSMLSNRFRRAGMVLEYPNEERKKSHIFSQEQYCFSEKEIARILRTSAIERYELKEDFSSCARRLAADEEQSLFDMRYYLPDDLLVKVDRASMLFGLEVRVPLLDHNLVEFALNICPKLRSKGGNAKYLLKEALARRVPRELFQRPKQGFAIPLESWLKNELSFLVDKYLSNSALEQTGVLDALQVARLIKDFRSGKSFLYNRVWLLIILQQWLVANGVCYSPNRC